MADLEKRAKIIEIYFNLNFSLDLQVSVESDRLDSIVNKLSEGLEISLKLVYPQAE